MCCTFKGKYQFFLLLFSPFTIISIHMILSVPFPSLFVLAMECGGAKPLPSSREVDSSHTAQKKRKKRI